MKITAILLILLISPACTKTSFKVTNFSRKPAQEEYNACREIKEELLIEETDFSRLDKSFENVKEYVFKNNCASCHFGKDSYLPHLDDYESTSESALSGKLMKAVDSGMMPPSYSLRSRSYDEARFLKEWVNLGAPL